MANIKFQIWSRSNSGSDFDWAEVEVDTSLVDLIEKFTAAVNYLDADVITKNDWSPDFHLAPVWFGFDPPTVEGCYLVVSDVEFWWEGYFKDGRHWDSGRIPIKDLEAILTEDRDYRENIEDEDLS